MLVNNFFIRCCLKNLTHQANPWSPSAFSASNQIPIGHVLTELLKIFLPEVRDFFQISVIVVVVVSRDSPPCDLLSFIICKTDKHEFRSIWKWISCCDDVMNHVDCVIKRDVYLQKMHSCSKNIRYLVRFIKPVFAGIQPSCTSHVS